MGNEQFLVSDIDKNKKVPALDSRRGIQAAQ